VIELRAGVLVSLEIRGFVPVFVVDDGLE